MPVRPGDPPKRRRRRSGEGNPWDTLAPVTPGRKNPSTARMERQAAANRRQAQREINRRGTVRLKSRSRRSPFRPVRSYSSEPQRV